MRPAQRRIVESAKRIASDPDADPARNETELGQLQGDFTKMLDMMLPEGGIMDKGHVERIKKARPPPWPHKPPSTHLF